jgi:outer membrane protein W
MQIASWLLVTSTLVAPAVRPATTAPVVRLTTAPPAVSFDAAQQRATVATSAAPSQAHRLGFGGSLAVSNYGVGGSTRYWFSKHVGLSMAGGWYRPRQYGYSTYSTRTSSSSTVTASPSLMVTFNSTDPNREVSLRPYLGVGVSYMHATSQPSQTTGVTAGTYSSTTPVGLGGVELFLRDHPSLTLSVDGTYYRLPSQFVNRANVNGLNFQVSAHFYLK